MINNKLDINVFVLKTVFSLVVLFIEGVKGHVMIWVCFSLNGGEGGGEGGGGGAVKLRLLKILSCLVNLNH